MRSLGGLREAGTAELKGIWWGGKAGFRPPVGPQGAGRIEPLRGKHARPFFFKYGLVGSPKISSKIIQN